MRANFIIISIAWFFAVGAVTVCSPSKVNASTIVIQFSGTIGNDSHTGNVPPEIVAGSTFLYKLFIDSDDVTLSASPSNLQVGGTLNYEFTSGTSRVFGAATGLVFSIQPSGAETVFLGSDPSSENFSPPNLGTDPNLPAPILQEIEQTATLTGFTYVPPTSDISLLEAGQLFADSWNSATTKDMPFWLNYTGFYFEVLGNGPILQSTNMTVYFPLVVDHVQVSSVPLPASSLLLVGALALLGFSRRKRRL